MLISLTLLGMDCSFAACCLIWGLHGMLGMQLPTRQSVVLYLVESEQSLGCLGG